MAAAAAFRANKFEEAESLYTEALEAAQQAFDRAAALSSRAQCRLKLKNFEGAREDAQAARALDPENPKAWYRLGVALSALGRLSEAQEALGEALQRRPEDADVQLALRAVLKRQSEGSEGRYDWLQVYQKYFETGPLAVAKSKGKVKEKSRCESEGEVIVEDRLIATLDVEPYVGPVRVGYSPERGRGLFVTEDVAKGRLLLCARALVTGLNEDLPSQLVAAAETSAHLMEAVRSLSRGHPESEQKMPALSMAQLAKPEDLIDGDEPLDQLPLEEARNILYHNQFSLPLVNPNAAPLEVGNDTERSGLWLLPVFVNHSCLPNVQRIIVLDCLFLRAGRDLKEGEELFDGYVETLQPLWHRRESLEAYGFRCSCERCVLEEAIYPEGGARREELRKILEQAAGAVASRTEGAQLAEQMEAVATAADILMDRALAAALQEGVVPSTSIHQVKSACLFAKENQPYPEVPAGSVRPVGGFRTEDLVAHEQSSWVGRVAEALYNVEVQVTKRGASGSGGRALGICLFQVCSEGHSMLDAAEKGCNQTSWQEMCPHFTGQKVEAGAKVWRQAEWLTEMPKFLNKRFDGYKSLEGTVTSVELQMLGVRWLDSWGKDIIGHHMPPEWVPPSCLTRLELSDSPSEGWSLGEHAQAVLPGSWPWQAVKVLDPRSPSAILTKTTTLVTVCWADGTTEEDLPSTQLLPRQEFYSHDFLPHDLVARSTDADEAWTAEPLQYTAAMAVPPVTAGEDYFPHLGTENLYDDPYEPPEGYDRDQFRDFSNFLGQVIPHQPPYPPQTPSTGEILPSNGPRQGLSQLPPRVPVGVVQTVDLKARTAVVEWRCSHRESPQEVSLFDLAPHPYFELRLGDIVFIPPYLVPEVGHWIGRVVQLQNFTVLVYLGNGAVRPFDLDVLRVASCDIEGQSEVKHGPSIGPEDHLGSDPEVEMDFDQLAEKEASPVIFPLPHDAAQELGLTSDAGRRFQEQLQDLQEQLEAARLQGSVQQTSTSGCDPGVPGVPGAPQEDAPKMYFYVVQHLPQMETGGSSSSTSRPETLALDTFDEDHEPLDHKFVDSPSPAPKVLMRAVRREMTVLRKGLLDRDEGVVAPILVRSYASRSDLFRAMVVGPPGTPYADLPFFFDLALSPQYPAEPPRVHYLSQFASSSERLNPNLYCDGKVCLSLLGTWPGPGWDPNKSTLLQVLVSLQGLVLVEDPYFNEPGHESDAKSEHGRNASALYNENVRLLCLRAALKIDKQPPRGFEEVVARHFSVHGPKLLAQCEEDLQGQGSEGFRQVLSRSILPKLRERWAMK